MDDALRVVLDAEALPAEVEGVATAFRNAGFPASVEATWTEPPPPPDAPHIGNGIYWLVEVAMPYTLAVFFAGFVGAAGADAWKKLKAWVEDIREARKGSLRAPEGTVVLKDSQGNRLDIHVVQEEVDAASLPEEAYQQLLDIDWSHRQDDSVIWDWERERWAGEPHVQDG